jgi:ParB-like chromosome segregation protein Spo0J
MPRKKESKSGEIQLLPPGMEIKPLVDPSLVPYITEQLRPLAVPIDDLLLDPRNARKHNDANLNSIVASFRRFGQRQAIVVNRDTKIIEVGNGRLLAAKKLGWKYIAVIFVVDDESTARGFAIADNRTAELAEWNEDILLDMIEDMQENMPDLAEDLMLEAFLMENEAEKPKSKPKIMLYQVLVDCETAEKQAKFQEEMMQKGLKCRILTV